MQALDHPTSLPGIHKGGVSVTGCEEEGNNAVSTVVLSFPDKNKGDIQESINNYHQEKRGLPVIDYHPKPWSQSTPYRLRKHRRPLRELGSRAKTERMQLPAISKQPTLDNPLSVSNITSSNRLSDNEQIKQRSVQLDMAQREDYRRKRSASASNTRVKSQRRSADMMTLGSTAVTNQNVWRSDCSMMTPRSTAVTNQNVWRSDCSTYSDISDIDLDPQPLSSNTPNLGPVLFDFSTPRLYNDSSSSPRLLKYRPEKEKCITWGSSTPRSSKSPGLTLKQIERQTSLRDVSGSGDKSSKSENCSQSSGLYYCDSEKNKSYESNKLPAVLPQALTQGVSSSKTQSSSRNQYNLKFMMDTFRTDSVRKTSYPSPRDDQKWFKHLDEDIIDDRTYETYARKPNASQPIKADSRYKDYNYIRKRNSETITTREGDFPLRRPSRSRCYPVFSTASDGLSAPVRKVGVVQSRRHERAPPVNTPSSK